MSFTPRKDERAVITALLEADYDTADALATAVLKRSFELLQQRDLVGLAVTFAGLTTAYGPFPSVGDAERAYKRHGVGVAYVAPLWGVHRLTPDVLSAFDPDCTCHHNKGVHTHARSAGRCAVTRCDCTTYVPVDKSVTVSDQ